MILKRRVHEIICCILIVTFFVTVMASCSADLATSQGNQLSSTMSPVMKNSPATPPSSNLPPSPSLFLEPSVKPTALPFSAKWNPYDGSWYDSAWVELDPVTQKYKAVPRTPSPGYTPPNVAKISQADWIANHQDSMDEIDITIIKYWQAMEKYREKKMNEDPNWMARSWFDVGQEEGGPLIILTDLGIFNVQNLIDRVQWENPFVVNLEIAICKLCRTNSINIGFTEKQVAGWRQEFTQKIIEAKPDVNQIALSLKTSSYDEQFIKITFNKLGILALPEVYEFVVNQGNTALIKYLPDILPLDKLKTYDIQKVQMEDKTLKQALESCVDDIRIIKTLEAK
jgi:hypothetical protein